MDPFDVGSFGQVRIDPSERSMSRMGNAAPTCRIVSGSLDLPLLERRHRERTREPHRDDSFDCRCVLDRVTGLHDVHVRPEKMTLQEVIGISVFVEDDERDLCGELVAGNPPQHCFPGFARGSEIDDDQAGSLRSFSEQTFVEHQTRCLFGPEHSKRRRVRGFFSNRGYRPSRIGAGRINHQNVDSVCHERIYVATPVPRHE
jgi:hypothetical protein